jgi:adenine C2-methylase RlmN of 23S rRNA A2503 and tRNA A37
MNITEQLDPIIEQRLDNYLMLLKESSPDLPSGIKVIDSEFTPDRIGMKIVFRALREDGKVATFETGSFLDNGGEQNVNDKHDICVSTAGGCTRACEFCSVPTATLGFERLLTAEEIAIQTIYAIAERNRNGDLPNVVGLMGNGEPPDNKAVIPAVNYLAQRPELGIKGILFSTIGEAVGNIGKMATNFASLDMEVVMQFSLHAANDLKRRTIIPGRRPLTNIMEAVDLYAETTGDPVKFNVVLMQGIEKFDGFTNASPEDANLLAELLQSPSAITGNSIKRLLKLSAYNSIPGIPFISPPEDVIEAFNVKMAELGVIDIQKFKGSGRDIDDKKMTGGFACGQLRATTSRTATSED